MPERKTNLAPLNVLEGLALRCTFRALRPARLPRFMGEAIRGALGRSLMRSFCTCSPARHSDHRPDCRFKQLFSPHLPEGLAHLQRFHTPPPPYVLRVPHRYHVNVPQGASLCFDLVLWGRAGAPETLPYWLLALRDWEALGLGRGNAPVRLTSVDVLGLDRSPVHTLYRHEDSTVYPSLPEHYLCLRRMPATDAVRWTVAFETPTRLRKNARLEEAFAFPVFLTRLLDRIQLLATVHAGLQEPIPFRALLDQAESVRATLFENRSRSVRRRSSRTGQHFRLDGYTGRIRYEGEVLPLFSKLAMLGTFAHVGQNATIGFGAYHLQMG